jgi:8-oxo-dGTP diphosphatase
VPATTPTPPSGSAARGDFIRELARPAVTVDIVVFTIAAGQLQVLLIERGLEPFRGRLALPGGFVRVGAGGKGGEDVDAAAARELHEETGLDRGRVLLAQLGAFGTPGRDPRGRTITVAYFALVRPELVPFVRAGSDAARAGFIDTSTLDTSSLAFDHGAILSAALAQLAQEAERSGLALALVDEVFTMTELRSVLEAIRGRTLDPGNFRRRFLRMVEDGLIERAPGKRVTGRRPAQVWRRRR